MQRKRESCSDHTQCRRRRPQLGGIEALAELIESTLLFDMYTVPDLPMPLTLCSNMTVLYPRAVALLL